MRDKSTTNWFGENIDEQEKRRQWLRGIYDNAEQKVEQTPLVSNTFSQTPYRQDIQQRINEYEHKYQNENGLLNGLKSMTINDWKNVGATSLQGLERVADSASLGLYTPLADKINLNYSGRKNQYYQEAKQAGIGRQAKLVDGAIDELGSNIGMGKLVSKLTSPIKINSPTKVMMDSATGSGITNVNRNGNWDNPEDDFKEGTMDSLYIQLMRYFNDEY